jgi:molecular chaperone GrpE (heat shock protein)
VNILLQICSRGASDLRAAAGEIGKLRAKLQELESEKEEWRKSYTTVEHIIANLREQVNSKNQEIQKLAPSGSSYCVSGANPYFLKKAVQRVSHALNDFVLSIRVPAGKSSTDVADLSEDEAYVSSILFSKFEREDFGVEGVAAFTPPPLLPELSFQEYKAFEAFMEDQEDCGNRAAVKPYEEKFGAFLKLMTVDILDKLIPLNQMEDGRHLRFWNLAMSVWMLHKLTLSFDKASVRVMRVGRGEEFNKEYMEAVPGRQDEKELDKLGKQPLVVQHLIVPGLWINGSIFKCWVFLGSPAEIGNQVGAVNGSDQPQAMDTGVGTVTPSEEPRELEPQPSECNQPSGEINSVGSELHMAPEASHPPNSEQTVNNDIAGSSDGAIAPGVCQNTEESVQVVGGQEDVNLGISSPVELQLPAAVNSSTVPGIGFEVDMT